MFGYLARVVAAGKAAFFDQPLLDFFVPARQPVVARAVWHALETAVGDYRGLLWEALLVAVLFALRRWQAAAGSLLLLGASLATTIALKPEFERPPLIDGNHGYFPSTHAAGALAFSASCVAVCRQSRARWAVAVVAVAVVAAYGANLVYTRSHYPSDVVAGWGVAACWTGLGLLVRSFRGPCRDDRTGW